MRRLRASLVIFCLLAGSALAAFVPPREGAEPFRRERVPLDVDSMNQLSRQLGFLAASVEREGPDGMRLRAQLLGLARVLDPANRPARDLLRELGEGVEPEASREMDFQGVVRQGWELEGWLSSDAAGADGRALGACLLDVLGALDPDHPRAAASRAETGAWRGWVEDREAFVDPPDPESVEPPQAEEPDEPWQPALEAATADFPLVVLDRESNRTRLVAASLAGRAVVAPPKPDGGGKGAGKNSPRFTVEFGTERATAQLLGNILRPLLEERHGAEIHRIKLVLSLPKGLAYSTARNGMSISAAAFLISEAIITGAEPTAGVIAEVQPDGSLKLPNQFWQLLAELESLDGRRWLMPAEAVESFPAMLTLGRASFFMKHEVLLARDADGLAGLASLPVAGDLPAPLAQFAEIQRVGQRSSLGSFVANPHTQARLRQVFAAEPRHASARMLALRGTSKWPRYLPREIVAGELLRAITPIGKAINVKPELIEEGAVDAAIEECRQRLEEIYPLLDLDDRELHTAVDDLLNPVDQVTKSIRKQNVMSDGNVGRARVAYQGLLARLRVEAGLPPK